MAVPGRLYGAKLGPDMSMADGVGPAGGPTTFVMAALNTGWCGRFTATQAKAVYSVKLNFSAVTAAGVFSLQIETIDATSGKPTGSLYDANAIKLGIVPTTGWVTHTFATPPTTPLTVGTEYGVVVLITTGGTTHTFRSHNAGAAGNYPVVSLQAADGTTRTNFAEVTQATPCCSLLLDDGTEDPMGMIPWVASANTTIFGVTAQALKVVIPTGITVEVAAVDFTIIRTGTPAGNLRIRIFDSSDVVVTNATVTVDKDSILNVTSSRRMARHFEGLVTLTPGTYRVVFDSAASANSSNCYSLRSATPVTTTLAPTGYKTSATTDVTAVPIVWTDSVTAEVPPVRLWLNDL